jgi:hypothetical protein
MTRGGVGGGGKKRTFFWDVVYEEKAVFVDQKHLLRIPVNEDVRVRRHLDKHKPVIFPVSGILLVAQRESSEFLAFYWSHNENILSFTETTEESGSLTHP